MFDKVRIHVKAGGGGDGAISFRKEKFVPYGGPDGGDGGKGGDVVVRADPAVDSLIAFRSRRQHRAESGEAGKSQKKHGRSGAQLVLTVPVGTLVTEETPEGGGYISDLDIPGAQVVAAQGGRGGAGNPHFASSTNQAPFVAQRGEGGTESDLLLEMRLIADVGIIGFPNAGKSTLLSAASAARPRVASYPFTTLEPVLGTVEVGVKGFVMAEIPGLVDDAHLGRGLGHDFLQHIIRTRILIHLIDASSASPVEDMAKLNRELALYDNELIAKYQIVVLNKVDLGDVGARRENIENSFGELGVRIRFISAATGEGVGELVTEVLARLEAEAGKKPDKKQPGSKVFRPEPKAGRIAVSRDGEVFVVRAPGLERLYTRGGPGGAELGSQMRRYLTRLGLTKAMVKAGIQPGDTVRCGKLEWRW